MCSMLLHTYMRTTPVRFLHLSSTRRCFLRSRITHHRHGRVSTSRSSTSLSCRPVLLHSHSSATCRSISASRTEDSLRTNSGRSSTSSAVRCTSSSDRNNSEANQESIDIEVSLFTFRGDEWMTDQSFGTVTVKLAPPRLNDFW